MNNDEINNKFKQWNPMENDYKNAKFNKYISGPGAEMDSELQPGQQAALQTANSSVSKNNTNESEETQAVPTLIFKKVPKDMTIKALYNICSKHGQVKTVRTCTRNPFYFVDLATVADMEAVLRGLENNEFGFTVGIARTQKNKSADMENNRNKQNYSPVPAQKSGIDYENRNYRTSDKRHPRPVVNEQNPFKSGLNNTDLPLKLLADDAHSLERQGLNKISNNSSDNKFKYRHGRSYVNMPEKTKNYIDKKHQESSGSYNQTYNKFKHSPEQVLMPKNILKCSICQYACDTVCGRCSKYYCSVECQIVDWPQHRYVCGKPEHLQKLPPQQNENHNPEASNEQNSMNKQISKSIEQEYKIYDNRKISQDEQPSCSKYSSNNSKRKIPRQISIKSSASTVSSNSNSKLTSVADSKKAEIFRHMPRSGNIVTITAVIKTNVVFIRSKTYDDNISYFKTIDTLQEIGKMLEPLTSLPQCGEMVIAKFENQFNRGMVCKIVNTDTIIVNFMEYGNMEYMKLEDLYEVPKEFLSKPRHAIPVLLKDVPNIYMTQEIRKFMYTYLNHIDVQIRYKPDDFLKENDIFAVELIDENTQQNLNKMIVKLAKPVEPQSTQEICERGYLDQKLLPSGENVELFVMDNSLMNSGCISCTTRPYALEIQKFQKELQTYAESLPNEEYTPRVQELCIARYSEDGLWYRGLCLETVGDGFPSIHFIDYGNITTVPIEDIRKYPRQFTFPIYTADCEIKGLPEFCDGELVTKLEELIPNGDFIKCEQVILYEEDNFYTLVLPNVIKKLLECGLLKEE